MITFDSAQRLWILENESFEYRIGLRDERCHHLGFLPKGLWSDELQQDRLAGELQPEAEVHIHRENRPKHHGLRWLGCSASQRAVYRSHKVLKEERYEELVISSVDPQSQLEINNHYRVYRHSPSMRRFVSLVNLSERQVEIEHLGSFSLYGMPFFQENKLGDSLWIHSFPASWCWEGQMKSISAEQAGLYSNFALGSWHVENTGSWSCKEYNPFFILEERGKRLFWSVQLEHSASWRFEVGGNFPASGSLYVQGGLGNFTYAHWTKRLQPGESFQSSPVSLAVIQGSIEDAVNAMHRHRANELIRQSEADRELPVIFNEWISTQGNVREETVLADIEQLENTGVDVYVLDAGWFLPYPVDNSRWFLGAGDWEISESRFPRGLAYAADRIKGAGMIPGIWFEVEIFGADTSNYERKTGLLMKHKDDFVEDNSRRFLYFGSEETRRFAAELFEKYIDYGFSYFKIDYNCDCGPGCTNGGESLGQRLVDHIRGYYAWLDELRAKHPQIIIENCSSGGNRMDYGLLARSDLVSVTDQPDWFRLVNSMMGRMHISGQLAELNDSKRRLMKQAIDFYKRWRPVLKEAKVYHHTANPSLESPTGWAVLQMNDERDNVMLLGCWRHDEAAERCDVCLRDVDPAAIYELDSFPEGLKRRIAGSELKHFVVELHEKFSAAIYGLRKCSVHVRP